MEFFRGVRFAIIPAIAAWGVIIIVAVAMAGCGSRRDDGMGDYWRGVKYVQERR